MAKVKINSIEYPVNFGYGTMRKFAKRTGAATMNELFEMFNKLQGNTDDIDFETLDKIFTLIQVAIEEGCRKEQMECNISLDDITDEIDSNPEFINAAVEAITESMPDVEEGEPAPENSEKKS